MAKLYKDVKVVPATSKMFKEVKLLPVTSKPKTASKTASKPKTATKSASKSSAPKYNPPAFKSVNYSDSYRKGINTDFYTNAVNKFTQQANANRATQIAGAQKQQENALRNAYVTRLQNEKTMNQNLASAGIRGGATETAGLRLAGQYGQAVQAANNDYAGTVGQINQNIDQSIFDYQSDMNSRAEEYVQNMANARWQAAREDAANKYNAKREDAINKWNAAREDKNNAYQRKQAEIQRQTEYWSNVYTNKFSGYSKKKVKQLMKEYDKKAKKAKNQYTKIKYQQAAAAAGARLGVIKNK